MEMNATFVNVGYGEAILLECPDPRFRDGTFVMLIDGGGARADEFSDRASGRVPLAEYLADRGLSHIDLMVSSHIHEDHISGMLQAAKLLPPRTLWQTLPEGFHSAVMRPLDVTLARTESQTNFLNAINDYRALCRLAEDHGGRIISCSAGEAGRLCDGLHYKILAPRQQELDSQERRLKALFAERDPELFRRKLSELDARMNNYSLILLLEYRGTRLLFPGDTNCLGYEAIDPTDLRAHLFKVGHHGQRDGADKALLEKIRPDAVVCCASSDRRYDSAHPDMLRLLSENGGKLFFSDCPRLPGLDLPPHRALAFAVGENGSISAQYLQ